MIQNHLRQKLISTALLATMLAFAPHIGDEFPEFAGRSHEVVGFGWHQGWQDGGDAKMAAEY